MSNKTTKNNKKEHSKKTKKTFMLMFDNEKEIHKRDIRMDSDECFEIDEIDIDKIRVSMEYPYGKNGKYRNFVFCEHETEYVLLKIVLRDVEGYYREYKGINSMNFMVNCVIFDIFENIELFIHLRLIMVMTILKQMCLEQLHLR